MSTVPGASPLPTHRGTGIADDKAIYSYMPEIVEFYTGEKAILENVPTWRCSDPDSLAYVLDNLSELVVKEVHGSGGYGMLIGPTATKKDIAEFRKKLEAKPGNYIAQPTLSLSTVPIFTKAGLAPRHVDLRPFVLCSPEGINITPGGLTRGGAEERIVGGEFKPGGRHQGHMGAGGLTCWGKTANGPLLGCIAIWNGLKTRRALSKTGQRIGLTRLGQADDEWTSVMQSAGVLAGYEVEHDEVTKDAAVNWMLRSKENPSSVLSTISDARQNARLVRTALTGEVWGAVNGCYMTTRDVLSRKVSERDLPGVLGTIRQRTALVRGATHGTMLRNDIYDFARIGTFLERADATARILDVKYYVLLPSALTVGSSMDNVHWETILRSVSARGGFPDGVRLAGQCSRHCPVPCARQAHAAIVELLCLQNLRQSELHHFGLWDQNPVA